VPDGACLSGVAAATDIHQHIEFLIGACSRKRLADDDLQGLHPEIVVHVPLIDDNIALAGCEIHSCDGFLSSACAVESFCLSHDLFSPPIL